MNEILLLLQISNSTFGYTKSGSGRVIKTFIHGMNEILLLLQISNSTFSYTKSGSGRVIKTLKIL